MKKTFFILILLISASCKQRGKITETEGVPEEGIYNVKILQKNYENRSFELFAKTVRTFNDTTRAENIKVIFFNRQGYTASLLFAGKGWYFEKNGNVGAFGEVKVYATRGDSMFTDSMFYFDGTKKVWAPGHVIIFRKNERIEGNGLKSDVNFEHVEIGGRVIGEK